MRQWRPSPPPLPPPPPPHHAWMLGSIQLDTLQLAAFSFVATLVARWLWQSWRREAAAQAAWERERERERSREALSHSLPKRGYTEAEVRCYNGVGVDRPILLAADGKVFNVTRGYEFYGEDSCYSALAGKDASRLLARGILCAESEEEATQPLHGYQLDTLKEWVELYEMKHAAAAQTHPRAHIEPHRINARARVQVRPARSATSTRPACGATARRRMAVSRRQPRAGQA